LQLPAVQCLLLLLLLPAVLRVLLDRTFAMFTPSAAAPNLPAAAAAAAAAPAACLLLQLLCCVCCAGPAPVAAAKRTSAMFMPLMSHPPSTNWLGSAIGSRLLKGVKTSSPS
jgi:hypothetical protein